MRTFVQNVKHKWLRTPFVESLRSFRSRVHELIFSLSSFFFRFFFFYEDEYGSYNVPPLPQKTRHFTNIDPRIDFFLFFSFVWSVNFLLEILFERPLREICSLIRGNSFLEPEFTSPIYLCSSVLYCTVSFLGR